MADEAVDEQTKKAALEKAKKAALDAEKERFASEKAVVVAQSELIKVKADLANAAEKARLEAEKATLDARKAVSDSQKAADLSAAQAAIGTVTGSGIEGTVTLKQDGGKGEATLLAAKAVATAGTRIATAIRPMVAGKKVYLLLGSEVMQFANYRQFLVQDALLDRAFDVATKEASRLADEAAKIKVPAAQPEGLGLSASPLLTTAGVAIDAITKLGSYFKTDYEAGGFAFTADGEQLVSAVAAGLLDKPSAGAPTAASIVLPGRRVPRPGDFTDTIAKLAAAVANAQKEISTLDGNALAATANNPPAAKLYEQAAGVLRAAVTKAQEFVTSLAAADAKGVVLMTKIVQEKIVCDALSEKDASGKKNARALIVDVRAAVGGYYTRKNLWTFLGTMPFFTMGGAVVTYALIDEDGALEASGLLPVHSGYLRVDAVKEALDKSQAAAPASGP